MKHITLGVLLFATTFVFAQENSEQPQPAESSTEELASTDSSVTERLLIRSAASSFCRDAEKSFSMLRICCPTCRTSYV